MSHAKILWNCRRGMLELDLILTPFAQNHLKQLTAHQCVLFERLLDFPDPDLYACLMGFQKPDDSELLEIVDFIRSHHRI